MAPYYVIMDIASIRDGLVRYCGDGGWDGTEKRLSDLGEVPRQKNTKENEKNC